MGGVGPPKNSAKKFDVIFNRDVGFLDSSLISDLFASTPLKIIFESSCFTRLLSSIQILGKSFFFFSFLTFSLNPVFRNYIIFDVSFKMCDYMFLPVNSFPGSESKHLLDPFHPS